MCRSDVRVERDAVLLAVNAEVPPVSNSCSAFVSSVYGQVFRRLPCRDEEWIIPCRNPTTVNPSPT